MASDPTPQQPNTPQRRHIELSSVQVIASVAAAVSAAIAASALGVGGTIVGTAVVSVVATVGNAFYSATLKRGKETLVQAHQLIVARPVDARPGRASTAKPAQAAEAGPAEPTAVLAEPTVRLRDAALDAGTVRLIVPTVVESSPVESAQPAAEPTGATEPAVARTEPLATGPTPVPGLTGAGHGQRHRSRPTPKRVAVLAGSAVLVFVAAFGVLTGIESLMGTSFAALFGHGDSGSTASALLHHDTGQPRGGNDDTGRSGTAGSSSPTPSESPSPAGSPSVTPSGTPRSGTGSTHTSSPSPSPRTSKPAPTASPSGAMPSSTPSM